jgi:lysophospholipase L1-like esterase
MRIAVSIALACALTAAAQTPYERARIVLVGDSTVAGGGGWGPGFAASFNSAEVEVINRAKNGRSSKSFRDEGLWEPVRSLHPDYVLIQFGHNDGPGKGPERETDATTTYRDNMARYADEARAAGAVPILVTSITRRNLTLEGKVQIDSLAPYVEEIRKLAAARHLLMMEMFALTVAQCEKAGTKGCDALGARLAEGKLDATHLSPAGQSAVGAIAAREFIRVALPGQPTADPKSIVANTLLPANKKRTTFAMPEPANPALPTLFIVGDSTVRNGRGVGANGLWGWGEPIADLFDTRKINVVNRAIAGQSSRTYITQGHWASVLALMKPDDFVILQFGHNDESVLNDPTRARGSMPGVGDDSVEIDNEMTGEHETVHSFGWYLRRYAADVRAKGATIIVCSPVPRKTSVRSSTHGVWAGEVARAEGLPFIDLNAIIADRYDKLGPENVGAFFPGDNTHTNRAGAELNAASVVAGLKALPANPLAGYLSR